MDKERLVGEQDLSLPTPSAEESFAHMYSQHAKSVFATALSILKNGDAANDVMHDVFLRAWQQSSLYDASRGTPGVWLRAMARNLSIDRLRSAQRLRARDGILDTVVRAADASLSRLLKDEQLATLHRGIDQLSPVHRQLIELSYNQELSHANIARRLGQPLGTVKSRIRQALATLRTSAELAPATTVTNASWLVPASEALTTTESDAETSPTSLQETSQSVCHVLVVDDDEETVRLVTAVLRKFKLQAEACTSAKSGLAALEEAWPDVMISDLNMPDEDGYSLIGKARAMAAQQGRRLRSAAFTSWGDEQERSRALIAGFDMFIIKPVHPLALISAVEVLSR